jgi:hypothetical protein
MRIKHRDKVKLARKMRTSQELGKGVPIFETAAWEQRKKMNQIKVNLERSKADRKKAQ